MRSLFVFSLLFSLSSYAQVKPAEVTVTQPKTFCTIEKFGAQKGQAASADFKKCDSLKDQSQHEVKSLLECKQRALTKGQECLKFSAGTNVAVSGKFSEKFDVSFKNTNFTCAVSKGAGEDCP